MKKIGGMYEKTILNDRGSRLLPSFSEFPSCRDFGRRIDRRPIARVPLGISLKYDVVGRSQRQSVGHCGFRIRRSLASAIVRSCERRRLPSHAVIGTGLEIRYDCKVADRYCESPRQQREGYSRHRHQPPLRYDRLGRLHQPDLGYRFGLLRRTNGAAGPALTIPANITIRSRHRPHQGICPHIHHLVDELAEIDYRLRRLAL
jgi:hypothetical protein